MSDMRKEFLVLASSMALALAACDRDANNNRGPEPTWRGGGPPVTEHVGSTRYGTFDDGAQPAPSASAAHEIPGMAQPPPRDNSDAYNEANGGGGSGLTGTKGEGETLHNGLNPMGTETRPKMGQKKADLGAGDRNPRD